MKSGSAIRLSSLCAKPPRVFRRAICHSPRTHHFLYGIVGHISKERQTTGVLEQLYYTNRLTIVARSIFDNAMPLTIMKAMSTTVTRKNQITIPAALTSRLDIQPETKIDWSLGDEDGMLVARVLPSRGELARQVAGMGRGWFPPGSDPVGEMLAERDREDEEEGLFDQFNSK